MTALMGYLQKISKSPYFYALLLAVAVQAGLSSYWYDQGKPSFYRYILMGLGVVEFFVSAILLSEARSYLNIGSLGKEKAAGIMLSAFIRLLGPFILVTIVIVMIKSPSHEGANMIAKVLNVVMRLLMIAIWIPLGIALAIYRANPSDINRQSFSLIKQNFKALLPLVCISLLFLSYPVFVSMAVGPASFVLSNGSLYILFSLISASVSFVIIPYLYLFKITEVLQGTPSSPQRQPVL